MSEDTFITQEGRLKGVPSSPLYSSSFHPSPYWDERPQLTKSGAAGDPVDLIVLHFISLPAGTFGGDAVDRLFMGTLDPDRRDWPQDPAWEPLKTLKGLHVSTHFFIRRNGEVIQYVPTVKRAWHAGLSNFRGLNACNDFSVGIELEGTGEVPFAAAQYQALGELLPAICRRHPVKWVTGHEFIAPGRKSDPGPFFDWGRTAQLLPAGVALAIDETDCDREALARRMAEHSN